jgi:hypothetical protein
MIRAALVVGVLAGLSGLMLHTWGYNELTCIPLGLAFAAAYLIGENEAGAE